VNARAFLRSTGLPAGDLNDLPDSTKRFPDGAQYRVEIPAAVDVPLDVYVEAPDNVGGFVRHHELPELIRVASPVYVKFGLRNAADLYPAGSHLESTAVALSRERVRRARLGLELLARSGYEPRTSERGAGGLALPVPSDKED
jgi:hypothetical protein